MRAEGGVRYACVGGAVALGRRGVDGPATGSDATSRGRSWRASGIATSSSDDADEALRTGIVRGVVRWRFDGVSGGNAPSSSSEADMSESENATLRFTLLAREGVRLAVRRADLVGDADRECEGVVVVGVSDGVSPVAFFLRISFIVPLMESFRPTHSSSSIFTRRLKILRDTPCFSTRGIWVMFESWGSMLVGRIRDAQIRATHLDGLRNPEKYRYSYVCLRTSDMGRDFMLVSW